MLNPAQLAPFKGYQAQMLSMQKMGFEMANKMQPGGWETSKVIVAPPGGH